MQKSITQILLDKYQSDITETSKKIKLEEASSLAQYETYFYDELPNVNVKGYPVGSDFIDNKGNIYTMVEHEALPIEIKRNCRLRYHYLPMTHEFYIGTTGSGKTTGCVEPQLRAIAYQKNKPNIFITDPKGELFNHNAQFLKDQGYKVFILNFKDLSRTDKWNPLLKIYESYMRLKHFKKSAERIPGEPDNNYNKRYYQKLEGSTGFYHFDGYAFGTYNDYLKYETQHKDLIISETDSLIRQLVVMICPITDKEDQTWELGSQQAIEGIIIAMLEDALDEEKTGFTKEMFTFKTLFDYLNALRQYVVTTADSNNPVDFRTLPFISGKNRVIEKLSVVYGNAPRTMRSYTGVIDSKINDWRQGHIFSLTTGNTIDIRNLNDPFAIFVITRDYEKSDFQIAGLFIDAIYKDLIIQCEEAYSKGIREVRPTHFLLDEFGNIPKIENFDNKIATSRSRNIWMHLFLQSYEQLGLVYEKQQAEIIISNCNSQIFLGSQSYNSIQRFSQECGETSTRRISDIFSDTYDFVKSNVVKVTELNLIEPGCMYNKRIFTPVIYSHYIRSYYLGDLNVYKNFNNNGLLEAAPNNYEGYSEEKFTYKNLTRYSTYHNAKDDFSSFN